MTIGEVSNALDRLEQAAKEEGISPRLRREIDIFAQAMVIAYMDLQNRLDHERRTAPTCRIDVLGILIRPFPN